MEPPIEDPTGNTPAALNTPASLMHNIPRIPTWTVVGLSIVSLGLYYTYWLFTRTQIINRIQDKKIPMGLPHAVIGLLLINFIFSIMSGIHPDNVNYQELASLSGLFSSLGNVFWVFMLRSRIHDMTQAGVKSLFWLNGIFTFLFQVAYLQYKLNEYLDEHTSDSSLAV